MVTPFTPAPAIFRGHRRNGRVAFACAAALLVGAISGGCSRGTPATSERGFRIGVGASTALEAKGVLTDMLYAEPLLATSWNGRQVDRVAAQWLWEDEGRTLRIQLKPSVYMHDGRLVTSSLVASILRPRLNGHLGFAYVTGIDTPSDDTVLVRLSRPDAFLIDALAVTQVIDGDIGTGPYKLTSRTPTIEAERNDAYHLGTPGFRQISIIPYDRQRTAWAAMMRGEVDMLQEAARESVDFLQNASQIKTYASIRPYYIPLVFNLRHPVLRRVDVRRALAEAIDREEIVAQAMRGRGMVADDPIWPFNWAYSAAARRIQHNPATAALRLDSAGLKLQPRTPGEMTSRFRLTCLFWREGPQFERIALLLQRQLAGVGVDLVLEPASQRELVGRVATGRFDVYLMIMTSGRTFDRTFAFWHSPRIPAETLQNIGYTGADAVLDRLRVARSEADVRSAVTDLRQRFYEDVPAAFLAWPETTRAVDARFDVGTHDDPDIFANLWRWHPASSAQARR